MTLNRDYVGQSVKSSEVLEVTQEKLRDAVAQFEEPHPAYTDPAAARELGYSAIIAPPAFAGRLWFRMVWAWPMNEPTLGRKPGSIAVLTDLRTQFYRPIMLGDRLNLTATVRNIRPALFKREQLSIESQISATGGELVCVTVHTLSINLADTTGDD
jgi:acyl dehydratase